MGFLPGEKWPGYPMGRELPFGGRWSGGGHALVLEFSPALCAVPLPLPGQAPHLPLGCS